MIAAALIAMLLTACATLDQKPVAQTFNAVPAPVPIRCIKPEDVPPYPSLTTINLDDKSPNRATHKQVDAANEADLESFRLYAEAARPLLIQCTKGISP